MTEDETLGKLAYEAYRYGRPVIQHSIWDDLSGREQMAWIAAAKAVAERVLSELQTAVEASE
jgi:hypothetical protein